MIASILGWIATILFSLMLIPQIIKTIKLKTTKGVSIELFIVYFVANCIALVYAMLIEQNPLILKYAIGVVTAILYIGIYVKIKGSET